VYRGFVSGKDGLIALGLINFFAMMSPFPTSRNKGVAPRTPTEPPARGEKNVP